MAVLPTPSPPDGVPVAGDGAEDNAAAAEDDDLIPLSAIFPISPTKKPSATAAEAGSPGGGRSPRRGRSFTGKQWLMVIWEPRELRVWRPRVGEGVPARLVARLCAGSRGELRLVSFFGGGRSRWLEEGSIRGFEEHYLRISKMAGSRLAREVGCAVAELGRRVALGMACGCRGVAGAGDDHLVSQIGREREGFEPAEMLGFVRGWAVCAWIGDGETICAVRVAAQVNAYRAHVLVGERLEASAGFEPEEALGTIRCVAVLDWVDDGAAAGVERVVAQLDAYRRFMSVFPDWVYQSPAEESSSSSGCSSSSEDSEGSDLEMPFISLSETGAAEDPDSFYENDMEEQDEKDSMMQEEMQPDGEFCTINRIDYSILDSDLEFEHLSDTEMEYVHNWSGENGVSFDDEEKHNVSTLSEDRHNCISNLIHGLVSSDSGQEFSPGRETSERDQDNEFNVSNAVYGEPELLSSISFDKSSVCIDSSNGFHGKQFDQSVYLDSSVDTHRALDFSSTDASTSSSLEFATENNSPLSVDFSLKHQPSMVAGMFHDEENGLQVHEMLSYLYSLASDPLYMRSESLLSFCQIVLSYRASMFQNVFSLPSMIWTEETQKAQELGLWVHHHLTNESGEKHQDDKVADMREHSSIAEVLFHTHDDGIELQSSVECHAIGDSIAIHSSTDVSSASKTVGKKYNTGSKFQFNADRRLSGKIVVDKRYAAGGGEVVRGVSRLTSPTNHDCEVSTQKRRFDQEVTSASSSKWHAANCLDSDVKASGTSMILLDNKRSNDRKAFSIQLSGRNDETGVLFWENAGYDVATVQSNSNFSDACNTSGDNTGNKLVTCSSALPPTCRYRASSYRNRRRLDQPVYSYISKRQTNPLFASETRLYYASPLVRDSSSATNRAQCSPVIGRRTGPSNSLHMKFPRGLNLPSKEDLEKTFSVFGPLDHSGTRVFFYTGAGKVVFLNPTDAETAYNYVRRNRLFDTNMRFWLDAHEKLRKGYSNQTFSLSREQMPALSLKSCLKTSSIHENGHVKKKCRVRFST